MTVYQKSFQLQSKNHKPNFHDVTEKVKEIVSDSGIKNGIATIYSQHTTCSVIIQEESHDATLDGTKYLLQDLLDVFQKIIPRCRKGGEYLHPGPEHIKCAVEKLNEQAIWSLNTDAHLRSCILGRSETIPIIDEKLELGEFG
jgi:secondary thiamine-phosphate synthase enzyme